tara:strand:+ start:189 stop:851 length:663 start_codon:yes stop_codon:yes gene_type:complete
MKLWKIVLFVLAATVSSCGIQKTPPPPLSGPWLDVPSTVKIDTLSYTRLNWKMRNSFTFRWNYAKYASNQPFSFYSSASFARFWNPFNSFEMYWNRHNFWYDWAFGYPYFNHYYSMPRYYMYEQPRRVAIMRGRRGVTKKVREDKVTIVANRLRNEVKINNNKPNRTWNNRNKFIPRENPGNFNSKITPRENPNINIQNTRPSRSIVNSTKVSMRAQIKN